MASASFGWLSFTAITKSPPPATLTIEDKRRIIERVAHLLREQVRSDDLIAQERPGHQTQDLHARFGGDEFCFLIPNLDLYR